MRVVAGQIGSVTEEVHGTDAAVGEMRTLTEDVAARIVELRQVMVRIVRTSSDASDRRRDTRVGLAEPAILVLDGRLIAGMCLDLSLGGARLRMEQPVPEGRSVALRLPGLADLAGKVVRGGEDISLRFDWEPDAAPAGLVERLRHLAAA